MVGLTCLLVFTLSFVSYGCLVILVLWQYGGGFPGILSIQFSSIFCSVHGCLEAVWLCSSIPNVPVVQIGLDMNHLLSSWLVGGYWICCSRFGLFSISYADYRYLLYVLSVSCSHVAFWRLDFIACNGSVSRCSDVRICSFWCPSFGF